MPTVVVNGVALEAKLGERLVDVSRRNGAHVGFVCDGKGICQMCQCRVIEGADQLNPPSEAERAWLPESRLQDGYRFACQAALRGNGKVEYVSTIEELRRQISAVVIPPAGSNPAEQVTPLLNNLSQMASDQVSLFPGNIVKSASRLMRTGFRWPVDDLGRYTADTLRLMKAMLLPDQKADEKDAQA